MNRKRVIIMGAAGRDFHNFNCLFRDDVSREVVAFTAAQIPDIEDRLYPPVLAGSRYPEGIPIHSEAALEDLVKNEAIDEVWFSYSDVSYDYVMRRASRAVAWGAHFGLCSVLQTMLPASRPVIAVTATRTGAGKSQTTRYISRLLKQLDRKAVVVRHPMPYGNLANQICQRFGSYEDLDRYECTIEEREEYEPHIDNGFVVYAGIDYGRILQEAESEAEVILWDGGNNDTPFFVPDLHLTVVDPHRPGHEATYYPSESNLLLAHLVIINKVDTADADNVKRVAESVGSINPEAAVLQCRSRITLQGADLVAGKRALVIEDGPTLTHGGMSYGAGWFAARDAGASEIVDPVPHAVGSIRRTYDLYPNARRILPAMGYGEAQIRELEATIKATPADVVVEGTPIDLRRILSVDKPIANVTYELEELEPGRLQQAIEQVLDAA